MWGFASSKSNLSVTVTSQRGVCRLLKPSVFKSLWVHLHLRLCVSLQMCVWIFTSTSVCVSVAFTLRCRSAFWCRAALYVFDLHGWISSSASIKWLYNTSNLGLFFGTFPLSPIHFGTGWNGAFGSHVGFIGYGDHLITTVNTVMRKRRKAAAMYLKCKFRLLRLLFLACVHVISWSRCFLSSAY